MTFTVGYWVAQEQYPPDLLLDRVALAEKVGFSTTATSDHFHPWFHTRGHSAFTWAWMASALERTRAMELGTAVTAVIYRYHPAIVAQAFSTLDNLYPGRVFLGVGSGEAMNEVPLGLEWPPYGERALRMEEAVRIIRLLWGTEDFVDFNGDFFSLRGARLYVRPRGTVPIFMAASGPKSAHLAGRLADGLLTYIHDPAILKTKLLPAFEEGARREGRDPGRLERVLELSLSYDEDYDRALEGTRVWASTAVPGVLNREVSDPRELEALGRDVSLEELEKRWLVTTDVDDIVKEVEETSRLGFTRIYLHSASPDEDRFVTDFGREGLPALGGGGGARRSRGRGHGRRPHQD